MHPCPTHLQKVSTAALRGMLSSSNVGTGGRGLKKNRLRISTPSCGLSVESFRKVCRQGNLSLDILSPAAKAILWNISWQTQVKDLQETGVSVLQLISLAWSHTLADRAQFHSWQSVSVSTGPCVSPRAITQQCAESKSLRELKDAPSARRWLHNPLDKDRKQIQVSASSTPSLTRPACRLEGRFGIRLATMRSISN